MNNRKNMTRKRINLHRKHIKSQRKKKGLIKYLEEKRRNAKRNTEYLKLKRENEANDKRMDKENLEFENDAVELLQSIESSLEKVENDEDNDVISKVDVETALAVGKNKELNKAHLKSRNKSMSGAKIVGKIKYKGGRRKKKKKTRRKRGKGTVQSRKKGGHRKRKTKKRKKRRK